MTAHKLVRGMWLSILLLSLATMSAQAPTIKVYRFKKVSVPGAKETDTYAVNDGGYIAGDYDSNNVQHGMILKGTKLTTIDRKNCQTTPGLGAIGFFGINNAQGTSVTVAGWCYDTVLGTDVAFTWSNNNFVYISPPASTATIAQGINDKGEVVGAYVDTAGAQHGFVYEGGSSYITLDVTGHSYPNAWSINDGDIVAIFALNTANNYDSYLYNIGTKTYKLVNAPGATDSLIQAIDSAGDRIYSVSDSAGVQGDFYLARTGQFRPFSFPKATATYASGLNDNLEIIGNYAASSKAGGTQDCQDDFAPGCVGYEALGCCRGFPPHKGQPR